MTSDNPSAKKVRASWTPPPFKETDGPRIISAVPLDAEALQGYEDLMDRGVEVLDARLTPIPRAEKEVDPSWLVVDESGDASARDDEATVEIVCGKSVDSSGAANSKQKEARKVNLGELIQSVMIGKDRGQVLEALHELLKEAKEGGCKECEMAFLHVFAKGDDLLAIPAVDGLIAVGDKKTVEKLERIARSKPELKPKAFEIVNKINVRIGVLKLPARQSRPPPPPKTKVRRARL